MQQQWEYMIFSYRLGSYHWSSEEYLTTSDEVDKLNEMGEQGWDLVSAYPLAEEVGGITITRTRYILKRPKL